MSMKFGISDVHQMFDEFSFLVPLDPI